MERDIVGKRPTFRPNKQRINFYRIMLWLSLIVAGMWLLLGFQRGQIRAPFQPTPTPTRMAESYILEAEAYFDAGKLDDPSNNVTPVPGTPLPIAEDATPAGSPTPIPLINDAIEAYQAALKINPNNAEAWAELARIQTYSSSLLRNDTERLERLKEARQSADKAVQLADDNSTIHAIRSFVLDWYASNPLVPAEESQEVLAEAYSEAVRAFNLDPNNSLALAYYAEILTDQLKWAQAEKYALQAATQDPNSMDTHRVYGYVLESIGQYNAAIQQYKKAAELAPNLTLLYILIGRLYREGIKNPDLALEYFARAAEINQQLGIQHPLPYIEIARTYTQLGEFFIAARNADRALEFDRSNAHTYGQLGQIFIRARNYEGAMPLLRCAVKGCSAGDNKRDNSIEAAVQGLPLTSLSVAYYYVEYGTVLAFLSRLPDQNYCAEARQVLEEVRRFRPDDPILVGIVEDSEGLCNRLESGAQPVEATEEMDSTPEPSMAEP